MVRARIRRREEDGASAVEFALLVIPLCLLLFGIITYAYMFSVRQALTQAAAEGARAAAVAKTDPNAAAIAAVNRAVSGTGNLSCNTNGLTCTSAVAPCGSAAAQCATVTVRLDYGAFDPFDIPLIPMPNTLSFTSSAEINP
ncbi:TadE/TadG family type IV pilus assembly protein [Nocardioides sp. Bht2]|uniref:TadE/TadG family type IV pilus assembly protein n=1 Tax=Nocardioides sp. Bht2 TaxID=3392297 RepID=UPI0039B5B16C